MKREKSSFNLGILFSNEGRKMFIFIYSLGLLRQDQERKFFFHLATTIITPWSRGKKFFFDLATTITTAWSREKSFSHLATMFTNEERETVFFSLIHYDHYGMT